jgi:tRNA (cmo5U34)-methyltransferase
MIRKSARHESRGFPVTQSANSLENWSQTHYAQEYRDNSDSYIQDRASLLRITASFAKNFLPAKGARVLDLGCGDGALTRAIHRALPDSDFVAADGSADMIAAARERLTAIPVSSFHCISFQDIIAGKFIAAPFDAVVSCLAIHHLLTNEKANLFRALRTHLKPGGFFLNADVILPENDVYLDWHFGLWKEWLLEREAALGLAESFVHVPERARHNIENHFDMLSTQMSALQDAGFRDVESHYCYGMFAIYTGHTVKEST